MSDIKNPNRKVTKADLYAMTEPLAVPEQQLIPTKVVRGEQIRRDDDTVQDFHLDLIDHDTAIIYYMKNNIIPLIKEYGQLIKVPVFYGNRERWVSVAKSGFFRDNKGKMLVPLIMFKRTNVTKRRDLSRNLDPNNPTLYIEHVASWSPRNRYDNFNAIYNRKPVKQFHSVVVPDYVTIEYECSVWTNYMTQMNQIIQALLYADGSYWGIKDRFKFYTVLDSTPTTIEVQDGDDRAVRSTFTFKISGYLLSPLQKALLAKASKGYSLCQVSFNSKTEPDTRRGEFNMIDQEVTTYLNVREQKQTYIINTGSNEAVFQSCSFYDAPHPLTGPTKEDFEFFINGQYIHPSFVEYFEESGSNCILKLIDAFDYQLDAYASDNHWEIVAIGKFR